MSSTPTEPPGPPVQTAEAHAARHRRDTRQVALLLQGGGALGAYQAGVFEGLATHGYEPDWVAGISIGSINAAIIAGNAPEHRVERLRSFWEGITMPTAVWPDLPFGAWQQAVRDGGALTALLFGQPGFFRPNLLQWWRTGQPPTSFYETDDLRATLERLVDFDRINAGPMRLSVGAVNVRTGNMIYFDTAQQRIGPEHVMASGALPPGFPAVEIDGEAYWDGGLVSNTPLQYVLDWLPRRSTLSFQVDLFPAQGPMPTTIDAVEERRKDVTYSSRTRMGVHAFSDMHSLRRHIARLLERLPDGFEHGPELAPLRAAACQTRMDIVELDLPRPRPAGFAQGLRVLPRHHPRSLAAGAGRRQRHAGSRALAGAGAARCGGADLRRAAPAPCLSSAAPARPRISSIGWAAPGAPRGRRWPRCSCWPAASSASRPGRAAPMRCGRCWCRASCCYGRWCCGAGRCWRAGRADAPASPRGAPADLAAAGRPAAAAAAGRAGAAAERPHRGRAGAPAMSARLVPVGWTPAKLAIDAAALVAVAAYLLAYLRLAPLLQTLTLPPDDDTLRMRAYGSCALLLLTFVLAIGPLARLDARLLPLLYNRRHLGVLTCLLAAAHVQAVLGWYFAYAAVPPVEAMLAADPGFFWQAIPFIPFGLAGFLVLLVLAATSHDFWLAFLGPPLWKAMHMAIYGAYAAIVLHIGLGALRDHDDPMLAVLLAAGLGALLVLHLAAAGRERRRDAAVAPPSPEPPWLAAGPAAAVPEGGAIVVHPPGGEPVAIFRHEGRLSAVSNLCAHQNGPLGEGRVVGGCITCPWHGFQYRLEDGCAPPPYTEKLPTFRLRLHGAALWLDPRPNPPGTPVPPLPVPAPAPEVAADFFIGWQATPPRPLRGLLAALALGVPLGFAALGLLLGRAADDPGGGAFDWEAGEQTLLGTVAARPYPLLYLPSGHTLLLSGLGKSGVELDPALDGRHVAARGFMIRRGTLEMLQVAALDPAPGEAALPPPVPAGRWRIAGEICDGKCETGAMRPGNGIAHRACAMLCLAGGVPPVFVAVRPVAGGSFLLLAGPDGGPMPAALRERTALRLVLEGTLERRGDLLVLRADPVRLK